MCLVGACASDPKQGTLFSYYNGKNHSTTLTSRATDNNSSNIPNSVSCDSPQGEVHDGKEFDDDLDLFLDDDWGGCEGEPQNKKLKT